MLENRIPHKADVWYMPIVINLDNRLDRLTHCKNEFASLGFSFTRISAVSASELEKESLYVTPGALACWRSHQLALNEFLKSDLNFALIFEDDFIVKNRNLFLNSLFLESTYENVDLFQFGFLVNDYKDRINLHLMNSENLLIRFLAFLDKHLLANHFNLFDKVRVRRTMGIEHNWIPDDFRAGAHCYLISRKMANEILKLNSPTFLTTDAFYESLNSVRAFRIFRNRKSLVGQINSASSIKNWGVEPGSVNQK